MLVTFRSEASVYTRSGTIGWSLTSDRRITAPLALRTLREHVEILEACVRRDAGQAEAALVRHFQSALQRSFGMS
jgi:DNA-binding GntR family transcriptional regulator